MDSVGISLWPENWGVALNRSLEMNVGRNRQFHLWLTDVGNDVLTRALKYAAYDPIAAAWDELEIPIANYDHTSYQQRLATPSERFGWHLSRASQGATLTLGRGGWLGSAVAYQDSPSSDPNCPQCRKAPFPLLAQAPEVTDSRLGPPVGPWEMNFTTRNRAVLHAPVLYPRWVDRSAEQTEVERSMAGENFYVPPGVPGLAAIGLPGRQETQWDATLRYSRYALDSANFSGIASEQLAPWVPAPGVPIDAFPGQTYTPTKTDFRRMLMLTRAKAVPRVQVFNLNGSASAWDCIQDRVYEEVFGPQYDNVVVVVGEPTTALDVDRIKNAVPVAGGGEHTLDVDSTLSSEFSAAATVADITFGNMNDSGIELLSLRIHLECEITDGSQCVTVGPWTTPLPCSTITQRCIEGLRGFIYLLKYEGEVAPVWVKVPLQDGQSDGSYRFPACYSQGTAGPVLDLSTRREFVVDGSLIAGFSVNDYVNPQTGEMKVRLVHTANTSTQFRSRWDLVQVARNSPACSLGATTTAPPPESATVGGIADLNFDNTVTAADLTTFAAAFSAGAPLADYDNDELVTSDDALTFLEDFVEQID